MPDALAGPYLATLAIPIFALSILAVVFVVLAWLRDRRRFAEAFESILEARPASSVSAARCGRPPAERPWRQSRRRKRSWESATWPCSPRTWASPASAS